MADAEVSVDGIPHTVTLVGTDPYQTLSSPMTDVQGVRPSALVTGGSRGIGFGIAEFLVAAGWDVTIAARHEDKLDAAADSLRGAPGSVRTVVLDMAAEVVADAIDEHVEHFGGLNGLVLSAGVGSGGELAAYPMRRADKQFAVNLRAPFALVSRALPILRRCAAASPGGRARIIAIASIEGLFPEAGLAAYGASKAALLSLARSINVEENRNGVSATAIAPAFVATALSEWATQTVRFDQMLAVSDVVAAVDFLFRLSPNAFVPEIVLNRMGAGLFSA